MKLRQTLTIVVLGFGSLALLASGAAADWLVASDGSRLETKGPFKVEGKLVIFTMTNGTLGSMPVSEVDLDATQALADEAATAKEPAAEPTRPKAVLVITDADVGHPNLNISEPAPEGEPQEAGSAAASAAPVLEVMRWQESVDLARNSVTISGTLQNPTENPATSIELIVMLYGEDGGLLEQSGARLERGFLNPGASTRFDAAFDETLSYDRVEFDIRSRGFMSSPPEDEPLPEDEDSEDLDQLQ